MYTGADSLNFRFPKILKLNVLNPLYIALLEASFHAARHVHFQTLIEHQRTHKSTLSYIANVDIFKT